MILLRDTLKLSIAKTRSKKLRSTVSILIPSIFLGLLGGALVISHAAKNSIQAFTSQGLGNEFLVQGRPDINMSGVSRNEQIQKRAQTIYEQIIADKKAEAKKLGITYSPESEANPLSGEGDAKTLNISTPAATKALEEYRQSFKGRGIDDFKASAGQFGATDFVSSYEVAPYHGSLVYMPDGKELVGSDTVQAPAPQDKLLGGGLVVMGTKLTKPYLLPTYSQKLQPNEIPLIVDFTTAESLMGLKPLASSSSAQEKLSRINSIKQNATSIVLDACYRNTVSTERLTSAYQLALDSKKPDFIKPPLSYKAPDPSQCGAVEVASDTRSREEKDLAQKQSEFDSKFGIDTSPEQAKLTFRIVGLAPSPQSGAANSAEQLLYSLADTSFSGVAIIPEDLLKGMSNYAQVSRVLPKREDGVVGLSSEVYYAIMPTSQSARNFIDQKGCVTGMSGTCASDDKVFMLSAFGGNTIALDDLSSKLSSWLLYAAFGIALLVILLIGAMVGRVISDGRRETAILRSIGFSAVDISGVYFLYVAYMALAICVVSCTLAYVITSTVDSLLSGNLTAMSRLAFGAFDDSLVFRLVSLNLSDLLPIVSIGFGASIAGSLLPLVINMRRDPVADLRDE